MNERKKLLIYAALSYVQCNLDDMNEAFSFDDDENTIRICGNPHPKFTDEEVLSLTAEFDPGRS